MLVFRSVVLAGVLAAIVSMFYFHRLESRAAETQVAQVSGLLEAGRGLSELGTEVEHFRDAGFEYKKMPGYEAKAAIQKTHDRFKATLAKLGQESAFEEAEKKQIAVIGAKLDQLVALCLKAVTNYAAADPFRLSDIRELQTDARHLVGQVSATLQDRTQANVAQAKSAGGREARIFMAGGGVILLLLFAVFFRELVVYQRPLSRLHGLALQYESGRFAHADKSGLPVLHERVAGVMSSLAIASERQAKERHKFMLDLFSDFSVPLSMLRAGKNILSPKPGSDDASQVLAGESVKRGLSALSGSLDDLADLAEFGNMESRLEERLVDLSEVVLSVSRNLTGPDSNKWISTNFPPMPVWVKIDARRMERVLTHVILKVAGTLETSERINVAVLELSQQDSAGVEILIQAEGRKRNHASTGSGPEVEITKHWISEKGLFLGLMGRIIRIQGGTITASGVSGTSAQVRIRLPQDRIVGHGLINAPRGLTLDLKQTGESADASKSTQA